MDKKGRLDEKKAGEFQDKCGEWVVNALNKALESELSRLKEENLHECMAEARVYEGDKEKEEEELQCQYCFGHGYTTEHNPVDPHIDGECSGSCPIQVECIYCKGTGLKPERKESWRDFTMTDKLEDKKSKPNCKWRDRFSYCHSQHQMGDDCEGKCSAFELGSKRFKSK